MKNVLVIQRSLAQYRMDFWNQLKTKLEQNGIALTLLYGKFNNENALKNDEVALNWATYVPNKSFQLNGHELNWQACLPFLKGHDMIIVEQANRNLINYVLNFRRFFTKQKLAYWGHGRNMQVDKNDIRNKFKRLFINQCDWWFAYTENVKQQLIADSFKPDRITCVENAIDTQTLTKHYEALDGAAGHALKKGLGICSDHVAIFCGSIYKEKRVEFLIEACDMIKAKIPDFHLLVIGSGPDRQKVIQAAESRRWIHYLGNKFGTDKVKYFKIASLYLMPGLVGLGILDAFAMETPLVTTDYPYHSPEIEYLENNQNGSITRNDVHDYVDKVVDLMSHKEKREQLIVGCRLSAKKFTVENMVKNFTSGIIQCLQN